MALHSSRALVVDEATGQVLLEKNSQDVAPMASITKLLTAMVVLDARQDPEELLTIATDDADEVFWAIVHSHVRSRAWPSPTDVALAFYPDALYLLVSLAEDEPALGAFRIVGEAIFPVELMVAAGT